MEYFKSVRFLTLLFLIVTLIIGCLAMIGVSRVDLEMMQRESLQAGYLDEGVPSTDEASRSDAWIVRAHDERIGVFALDGKLECVLDVYLITLPQADRELLQKGIYISGKDRLTALVEDYTG